MSEIVEEVRALAYGRPTDRTVEGMWRERRGICSTKHLFLWQQLGARFPQTEPRIVHRVYRVSRARARELFGSAAAAAVPDEGLTDVHRYLLLTLHGRTVRVDATFPGDVPWDGRSDMPLACGDGPDFPAGDDPDADKCALEARFCDPAVREPFIAALTGLA